MPNLPCRLLPLALVVLAAPLACDGPPAEEPGPEEPPVSGDEASDRRHAGEEGKMGKPTSKSKSGLYALKGPKDAVPQSSPASTGDGTVGLGNTGLIGKGGGGGTGAGYGRGSGAGFGGRGEMLPPASSEDYAKITENEMKSVADEPLSTFSVDVDTASYSNMRRMVEAGRIPHPDAVRVEEFINYFSYDYPEPKGEHPFSITTEVATTPWAANHQLVHIGIKGQSIDFQDVPPRNLVFLLDVSGSMNNADKLPLLKQGLGMLVRELRPADKVSIVVYAGSSGLVLPPTSGKEPQVIMDALDRLSAGGSTNGGAGIQLAYQTAEDNFIKGGINRVILATDGDFNVGTKSRGDLERLIENKREGGVFLTVLGFGGGNLKDSTMELLADKGNGNYAYIDSAKEAKKVLVREAGATLVTIAKDVKLQVEFNPRLVAKYRLVGYENRKLAAEDFNDDTKDAGEIGAGHTVTALYELELADGAKNSKVDPLKYRDEGELSAAAASSELLTVKFRYKQPDGETSKLLSRTVQNADANWRDASDDFRFSAAVASFGMVLRDSKFKGTSSYEKVSTMARDALGKDSHGYRSEFVSLVGRVEKGGLAQASAPMTPGRSRRVPRVRQAELNVQGPLDRQIIRRIIRAHINEIRHCYNQALSVDPNLSGRVQVDFVIDPRGKVSESSLGSSSLNDGATEQCMTKAMSRWKYPKPPGGEPVLVSAPFSLSPG